MYSVPVAYLLWLISGFGALGFHRIYMGKIPTGILWMLTGGLGMVGAIYDFFTLPGQVEAANWRRQQEGRLSWDEREQIRRSRRAAYESYSAAGPRYNTGPETQAPKNPEQSILRIARANRGLASPAEVALEADLPLELAKGQLEKMADQGYCEMRVKKTGAVTYYFAEFADQYTEDELEGF